MQAARWESLKAEATREERVDSLPTDYLGWLLSLGDGLREPLRSAVESEYQRRQRPRGAVKALPAPVRTKAQELVQCGYRSLAQRYHPDHGGNTEAMTAVNLAVEWLREVVEQAA